MSTPIGQDSHQTDMGKHSQRQLNLYERLLQVSQRIHAYAYNRADVALDFTELSDAMCLSPYHGHRLYRSAFGETISDTVKRLRLHHAAYDLAHSAESISAIGQRSGYATLPSFSRVFSQTFGMSPSAYREAGFHVPFQHAIRQLDGAGFPVKVQRLEAMPLIGVLHEGAYMGIGQAFDALQLACSQHQIAHTGQMVGVYYEDPFAKPDHELRSLAAFRLSTEQQRTLQNTLTSPTPLQHDQTYTGECAVLHYQGPYASMHSAYEWLFGAWLPHSSREAADAPVFELYLNQPQNTEPAQLRTDIYLPLKPLS